MTKSICILVLAMSLLAITPAQVAYAQNEWGEDDTNPGEFGSVMGPGKMNCLHWLSSSASEHDGDAWILGWWTAANQSNTKDHFVGEELGPGSILREVRNLCRKKPSMALTNAVAITYSKISNPKKTPTKIP